MTKRQEGAYRTRKKLVDTALELIRQKGFGAINVEDITSAAGVAKGTFYVYFKRKEDIVLEISRLPFADIARELKEMKGVELIDRLAWYFNRFMEQVERCGINVCREWIRNVIDPNNVPESFDAKKWFYDYEMLEEILRTSPELKNDAPFELLTHIIISELYGMMLCWCMSDGKFEPLDWTDKFCANQLERIIRPYLKEEGVK